MRGRYVRGGIGIVYMYIYHVLYCKHDIFTHHRAHVLDIAQILGQMPHGNRLAVQPLIVLRVVAGGAYLWICCV